MKENFASLLKIIRALITFMFMMPYGVLSYSAMIPDLPTASLNMGVVKIEE